MATPRLTSAQLELLDEFKDSQHPDRCISGPYLRTAEALVRAGLLKRAGGRWYEITSAGYEISATNRAR